MTTWSKYTDSPPGTLAISLQPKYTSVPKPAVLYCHAAGSIGIEIINPYAGQGVYMQRIASNGHNCFSGTHAGSQSWGNAAALTAMTASYNTLQAMPGTKPGKIALVGASMGGLCALNWAAANPTKVSCIVATIPVINVTDIKVNDRQGYGYLINAAYGGSWTEGQYGATSNPRTMATLGKFGSIPMLFFYGTQDTLCMPAEVQGFAAAVGSNVTLVPVASGHDMGSYALANHDLIVDFIEKYA